MVIKGNARGSPADLAKHLQRTDTNERMEVKEIRGVAALDLTDALKEMDAQGAALRTTRTLYHASINTRADEHLTGEQMARAIDQLEEKLGLTGQPRAIVEHEKEGRAHWHIVWARTDLEHMRAIRCDHNYRKHEEVARELEREFGHARVQGAHAERDGKERPERTPSHAEMQQAERTELTPKQAKEQITAIWRRTDSGKAFAAALEQEGWILAQGDRRDFVVIDRAGEVHSLAKRVDGAKMKDVRERMADIDAATLPTVDQAKEQQRARQIAREEVQRGQTAAPAPTPAPQIPIAAPTPVQTPPPAVIVTQEVRTATRKPNRHHVAEHGEEGGLLGILLHSAIGHAVTDAIIDHVTERIGEDLGSEAGEIAQDIGEGIKAGLELREVAETIHEITAPHHAQPTRDDGGPTPPGLHVAVAGEVVKLTNYVARLTAEIVPPRTYTAGELAVSAEARRENQRRIMAERESTAALGRMGADIAAGRNLNAHDVNSLSPADLQTIKDHGDAGVIDMVRRAEHAQARKRDEGGRERER